ncbi:isopentenyl phosphate kinase [Methanopyrus sp.]
MFTVLKLGGSVITDKSKPMTARKDRIRRLMKVISDWRGGLVLIHGGGSFGHYAASSVSDLKEGVSKVRRAMHELLSIVEKAAVDSGVRVYPVTPATVLYSVNVLVDLLERGCVPLLYGDVVPDDSEDGFRIMSGDEIAERVSWLGPDRVGFGMSVDGVYPGTPEEGEPLRELSPDEARGLARQLEGSAGVDVTGGIAEKLRRAARIAERGVEVYLFDARDPENVDRFLRGEHVGTRISR